jgi:hypothetical protein
MKGPHERLKYDLRRLWECPVCQRRERTPGSVASRQCLCQMKQADGKPVVMKLVEDGVQRVVPKIEIKHEQPPEPTTLEAAAGDDRPVSAAETTGPTIRDDEGRKTEPIND